MERLSSFRTTIIFILSLLGSATLIVWISFAKKHQEQLNGDLLIALRMGQVEEVKFLLKQGADPNARDTSLVKPEGAVQHNQALTTCSYFHEVERVPTALSYATDFSVMNLTHNSSVSYILVKLLLDNGANVQENMECEHPALFTATLYGDVPTVELLLDHGADANTRDCRGMTALEAAKMEGTPPMVRVFINHGMQ